MRARRVDADVPLVHAGTDDGEAAVPPRGIDGGQLPPTEVVDGDRDPRTALAVDDERGADADGTDAGAAIGVVDDVAHGFVDGQHDVVADVRGATDAGHPAAQPGPDDLAARRDRGKVEGQPPRRRLDGSVCRGPPSHGGGGALSVRPSAPSSPSGAGGASAGVRWTARTSANPVISNDRRTTPLPSRTTQRAEPRALASQWASTRA